MSQIVNGLFWIGWALIIVSVPLPPYGIIFDLVFRFNALYLLWEYHRVKGSRLPHTSKTLSALLWFISAILILVWPLPYMNQVSGPLRIFGLILLWFIYIHNKKQ